jgi:hypothetical protein
VWKAVAATKFSSPELVTKLLIGQISLKQASFLFYWWTQPFCYTSQQFCSSVVVKK